MVRRGGATGRTGAPTSSSASTSTSSGSSSASTSSSSKSSGQAGARSTRSSSSVSVSSPSGSKTVTTVTEATPTQTTKETTAQPEKAIQVSAELATAIADSQQAYPDAWTDATGTSNVQKQFEQVTGTTIPSVIVDAPEVTIPELPEITTMPEIILADDIIQILNDIESGVILIPDWFRNNIEWVQNGHITQQEFRTAYNQQMDAGNIHPLEQKETWWVIRPSGLIEEITVTQNFVDKMTLQGWIFSKDKPLIEQAKNQNISIVFYIGKGGDLKTHFGINSIVITPDEAEHLAGWLYQNYNTKILFVMNRLTDDVRTHTLQQLKDLIIQKLKDDQPESDDIDDDDIKKPTELGFMAKGVAGAIAGLVLLGFIADYKGGK